MWVLPKIWVIFSDDRRTQDERCLWEPLTLIHTHKLLLSPFHTQDLSRANITLTWVPLTSKTEVDNKTVATEASDHLSNAFLSSVPIWFIWFRCMLMRRREQNRHFPHSPVCVCTVCQACFYLFWCWRIISSVKKYSCACVVGLHALLKLSRKLLNVSQFSVIMREKRFSYGPKIV